ncbi:MAG: hypothetical protein Q9212_006652 [Teloschistes hypoglaucus]
MPSANGQITQDTTKAKKSEGPSKLILCFDGTGNQFKADPSDTNIVKLYQKFDRRAPNQFHYYQPGIGTYSAGEQSVNTGLWGKIKRWFSQTVDAGLGTSFDQHVIAGYRFAMRYHEEGDKIFMFGFSRGAFTARFLARMISTVGLLSKGNEELVPFAYRTYQEYEMGDKRPEDAQKYQKYMEKFKATFCRDSATVHFLGLFDTVSSVGYFETGLSKRKVLPEIFNTATHVRHAVAIDERRCKFKAALLSQDNKHESTKLKGEDIQEVFFPGNHGDVGGGWPPKDSPGKTEAEDPLQLSDLALEWMIAELDKLPKVHPTDQIIWNTNKDTFLNNFHRQTPSAAIEAQAHDLLRYGGGAIWLKTFLWRLMDYERLPFVRKLFGDQVFSPGLISFRTEHEAVEPAGGSRHNTRKYISFSQNTGNGSSGMFLDASKADASAQYIPDKESSINGQICEITVARISQACIVRDLVHSRYAVIDIISDFLSAFWARIARVLLMRFLAPYAAWCTIFLTCIARPFPSSLVRSSVHHESLLVESEPHSLPLDPSTFRESINADTHLVPRSDSNDTSGINWETDSGSPRANPGTSLSFVEQWVHDTTTGATTSAAHHWQHLPTSINMDLPSSSGPFTPVELPPQWQAYPFSNTDAVRPVILAASILETFYTVVLEHCAKQFWAAAPASTLLKWRLGALKITVKGQSAMDGLPWGVLALLVQGMLERARRLLLVFKHPPAHMASPMKMDKLNDLEPPHCEPPQCSGLTEQLKEMVPSLYDPHFEAKSDHGSGADFFFDTTRQLHILHSAYVKVTAHVDQAMESTKQKIEETHGGDHDDVEEAEAQELQKSLSLFLGSALEKATAELKPVVLKAEAREIELLMSETPRIREVHPDDEEWLDETIGKRLGSSHCQVVRTILTELRKPKSQRAGWLGRAMASDDDDDDEETEG